jgi:O-antigen ligase
MYFKNLSNDLNLIKNESLNNFFSIILISLLPIFIVSSSILINLSVTILGILFLFDALKNRKFEYFNNKIFILLIIFFIFLIINLFLSINFNNSLPRSVGFIRYVLLAFGISYYFSIKNFKYFRLITTIWMFIFIFISFDLMVEYFSGKNLFGMSNVFWGRLSGVMNDELKIGGFYFGFYFFFIASLIKQFPKQKFLTLTLIIIFTVISFLIGERSNFLKVLVGLLIFLFFWEKYKLKFKIITLLSMFVVMFLAIDNNKDLKARFFTQFANYIIENGVKNYYYNSQYGAHYGTSIKIFKNYPLTGIGLKNFMEECYKDAMKKYDDENFLYNKSRCSTHPHQLNFEILSQTGIIGYGMFLSFFVYFILRGILIYNKNKNVFHLGALIFIFTSIFLPLPSGSFFTTFGASIFWINFGLALTFEKVKITDKEN